ncbi:hypothetical protein KIN20_013573 [Parelaphostrongylus tenuis]|uniref:Uncharacterized protein n=1 Tax=Parelaphostrongylus tenuis TaxID=148309 RepID=A0AAD5MWB4_PARTN|nr:hypothetical protein KIN20_013573 [Parelaphostrongylus tenuis]
MSRLNLCSRSPTTKGKHFVKTREVSGNSQTSSVNLLFVNLEHTALRCSEAGRDFADVDVTGHDCSGPGAQQQRLTLIVSLVGGKFQRTDPVRTQKIMNMTTIRSTLCGRPEASVPKRYLPTQILSLCTVDVHRGGVCIAFLNSYS